jgi:hypothetical protein
MVRYDNTGRYYWDQASNQISATALSFAKNASAGIALRYRAFVTVMQAAEVRNLNDRSDTRDLPNLWTLLVET